MDAWADGEADDRTRTTRLKALKERPRGRKQRLDEVSAALKRFLFYLDAHESSRWDKSWWTERLAKARKRYDELYQRAKADGLL